jgi:hypothetical protein
LFLGVFSARRDSIILIFILFFYLCLCCGKRERERERELNIVEERVLDNNE